MVGVGSSASGGSWCSVGKANVEGNCYTTLVLRGRVLHGGRVVWDREFGVVLARRAKGEGDGLFIINLISILTPTRGYARERVSFHGDMVDGIDGAYNIK